jgi:hypothetical protein
MSDSRTRIWFSLFVLAVFCVGLASGLVLGRRMGPPPPPRGAMLGGAGPFGPPPGRPGQPGMLLDRLERDLRLTTDQRAKLEPVFAARRVRLEAVQRDVVGRAEQEQKELQAEIRKVLTAEQLPLFDRWLEDAPRGRRGRGPGPGFGGR